MANVTSEVMEAFFERLGKRLIKPCAIYLLGGCALNFLGNKRSTLDIDYTVEMSGDHNEIEKTIEELGREMMLDVEFVPLGEFIPLPPDANQRRQLIGKFGNLDVFIFDLYSIALSKIARGFEADLEDVEFLLQQKLINFNDLEKYFHVVLPDCQAKDIDPKEFARYFQELKSMYGR